MSQAQVSSPPARRTSPASCVTRNPPTRSVSTASSADNPAGEGEGPEDLNSAHPIQAPCQQSVGPCGTFERESKNDLVTTARAADRGYVGARELSRAGRRVDPALLARR